MFTEAEETRFFRLRRAAVTIDEPAAAFKAILADKAADKLVDALSAFLDLGVVLSDKLEPREASEEVTRPNFGTAGETCVDEDWLGSSEATSSSEDSLMVTGMATGGEEEAEESLLGSPDGYNSPDGTTLAKELDDEDGDIVEDNEGDDALERLSDDLGTIR